MKITKLGHCCLLIETDGVRLLTDPGIFSTGQEDLTNIDAVVITHEHQDHLHVESLKRILQKNPGARVLCNQGVAELLRNEDIAPSLVEEGQEDRVNGVLVQGYGHAHALIYPSFPSVINTGYRIAERFFYPGDALTVIKDPVEILALPVAGPWLTIQASIDYALAQRPRVCFPVHDGLYRPEAIFLSSAPGRVLVPQGIAFEPLAAGQTAEF